MKSFASLRKLWKQRPFEPFRIVTDTGTRYDVPGPEYIMVTRTTLAVVIGAERESENKDEIFGFGPFAN